MADIYDEESTMITLTDENGENIDLEFLDLVEYQGEEYVVLLPPDEDEVVVLKIEETDDPELESYCSVDDEDTLNAVFEIFKAKFADEFNFVD